MKETQITKERKKTKRKMYKLKLEMTKNDRRIINKK